MILLLLLLLIPTSAIPVSSEQLSKLFPTNMQHPFLYDLGVKIIPSAKKNADVMICCHGYGSNGRIIDFIAAFNVTTDHLISFNFPDYDCITKNYDPAKSTFGSIDEILPLLFIIKKCVIDAGTESVSLYGFSAGGGAVINTLAALNQTRFDDPLKKIGINSEQKKKIITALQNGIIILDCPLKSMEEIIASRGKSTELVILEQRYAKNNMRPIDALANLKGLPLTMLLHFQTPDEILGNRDDALFIKQLQAANQGTTQIVLTHEGGHNTFHQTMWKQYAAMKK